MTPDRFIAMTCETRQVYMMLYRTHVDGLSCWPQNVFDSEITFLIDAQHAERHEDGYRLTPAGIEAWAAYVKVHTSPQGNHSDAPDHLMLKLLNALVDGRWHETGTLIDVLGTLYNVAACRAWGSKQRYIELRRERRVGYARITDKGRKWIEGQG